MWDVVTDWCDDRCSKHEGVLSFLTMDKLKAHEARAHAKK